MSNDTVERTAVVTNPEGLHMRPMKEIAREAGNFEASIEIRFADKSADAKSMMSLMLLVAKHGATLTVVASGSDAEAAVTRMCELIETTEV